MLSLPLDLAGTKPEGSRRADVLESAGAAGKNDDLATLASVAQDCSHAFEPLGIGVAQSVVEDERDSIGWVHE